MKLSPFSIPLTTSEVVEIREIGPRDKMLLQEGFEHLSRQSRAFRFLAAHPRLTTAELARFTAPNDADHFAIGAMVTKADGSKVPVGTARYIRLAGDRTLAEFATTIIDDYQGHGLGSLMLGVLAKHAVSNGISGFVAFVHGENLRMLNLLGELDALVTAPGAPEVEFHVPLFADAGRYPQTPAGNAFRSAYRHSRIS